MMTSHVYLDGDKLKFLRVIKNHTHRSLAERSGVSTSTIWHLESNIRNERFHPSTLHKLAEALGVEPTELLGGDEV
jgi:transcriptional regulator with XRE-family HTH domain